MHIITNVRWNPESLEGELNQFMRKAPERIFEIEEGNMGRFVFRAGMIENLSKALDMFYTSINTVYKCFLSTLIYITIESKIPSEPSGEDLVIDFADC